MEALRRASAAIFYLLGVVVILGIVLSRRGIMTTDINWFLNILDLPLLLSGMLFGGSSLVVSLSKGSPSKGLMAAVFIPLVVIFALMVYINFWMPFA